MSAAVCYYRVVIPAVPTYENEITKWLFGSMYYNKVLLFTSLPLLVARRFMWVQGITRMLTVILLLLRIMFPWFQIKEH